MKRLKILFLSISVWVFVSGIASAITITTAVSDISDTNSNQDLWEYAFSVSDYNTGDGFTIYFDYISFGAIDPDGIAANPNSDWDVLTWNPDTSLPDGGGYDAYALDDAYADLAETVFTVQVVLLSNGDPSAWSYETYDAGQWNTVPEPTTALLFGLGLIGVAGSLRKKK